MSRRSNWGHGNHFEKRNREQKFRTAPRSAPPQLIPTTISTGMFSYGAREVHPDMRAMIDAKLAAKREGEAA